MITKNLSAKTQNYIARIYLYDGVINFVSLCFVLSTLGILGMVFWVPFALYTAGVGYLCRQHARCEDDCYPYIVIWLFFIIVLAMLSKAGGAIDKITKDN